MFADVPYPVTFVISSNLFQYRKRNLDSKGMAMADCTLLLYISPLSIACLLLIYVLEGGEGMDSLEVGLSTRNISE